MDNATSSISTTTSPNPAVAAAATAATATPTMDPTRELTLASLTRCLTNLPAAVRTSVVTLATNGSSRPAEVEEGLRMAVDAEEISDKDGKLAAQDMDTDTDAEVDSDGLVDRRKTEKRDSGVVSTPSENDPHTNPDCNRSTELTLAQQTLSALEPRAARRPLRLLTLPPELLLMLFRYVDFADIVQLRRTCKTLRNLATPAEIAALLGQTNLWATIRAHCRSCLKYDQYRGTLLLSSCSDPEFPLSSSCIPCAMKSRDKRILEHDKVRLGDYKLVWNCRRCGWPVIAPGAAENADRFHKDCLRAHHRALFSFFVLGCVQLGLGIVGCALAWRYFRNDRLVFAPTVTNFILMWIDLVIIIMRDGRVNRYTSTLVMETIILSLWIPPIYSLVKTFVEAPDQPIGRSTMATLVMFALNALFRALNVLGNLILVCGYNPRMPHFPNLPWWRKWFLYPMTRFLITWTCPQAVEVMRYLNPDNDPFLSDAAVV